MAESGDVAISLSASLRGNQPHSEVAALAIFLDRLTAGKGLRSDFPGKIKVLPCERGKRVVNTEDAERE